MKKIHAFLAVVLVIFAGYSCSPRINHAHLVYSKNKNDSLMFEGKAYIGDRTEFLAKFGGPSLVLKQPDDTLEMVLIGMKESRRTLFGKRNFGKNETVTSWRKQTTGIYKDRWFWYSDSIEEIAVSEPKKKEFPKRF